MSVIETIESLIPLLDKEGLERIQARIKAELDVKSQVVYFIEAKGTGKVKIGKTNDIQKRLSGLQTSCPHKLTVLKVIPYTCPDEETKWHNIFAPYREDGEWFRREGALDLFLNAGGYSAFKEEKNEEREREIEQLRVFYDRILSLDKRFRWVSVDKYGDEYVSSINVPLSFFEEIAKTIGMNKKELLDFLIKWDIVEDKWPLLHDNRDFGKHYYFHLSNFNRVGIGVE